MSNRYAVINIFNVVTNVTIWDGQSEWTPDYYQAFDAEGVPVGGPTPQTAVPDTDPPTAQIGFVYKSADGSFTNPNPIVPVAQTG